jgi:hypothetical protein
MGDFEGMRATERAGRDEGGVRRQRRATRCDSVATPPSEAVLSFLDDRPGKRPTTVWSKSMKIVVTAVVSLALAVSLAGQVSAAPLRNKKQAHRQHTMTKPSHPRPQGGSDYFEHVLEKVPFGSQRWWSVYDEQHGVPN